MTGSVVRDGVWFHPSPFLTAGPGPGAYSPSIISSDYERGRTAKPSSGAVGRQVGENRPMFLGTVRPLLLNARSYHAPHRSFREHTLVIMYIHTSVKVRLWRLAAGVTTGRHLVVGRTSDPVKDHELNLYNVRAFFFGVVGPSMHSCFPTFPSRVGPGDNFVAF